MREQLTESDVKKIQEEIDHRKLVIRKEAIEAVKEARAQGDLSENFEYYAAKKYKNQMKAGFAIWKGCCARHPLFPMNPNPTKWELTIPWNFILRMMMRWKPTAW